MKKLLFVGDAGCESGFAKATHRIMKAVDFRETPGGDWDVSVLGMNYRGDPHPYPYPIYPAHVPGTDLFGVKRLLSICDKVHPDLIVFQNDPWNIPPYTRELQRLEKIPATCGIIAVDGKNCLGRSMNGLTRVVFWTKFAQDEAYEGGLTRPTGIVPLGVDLDVFKPVISKQEARRKMGLPEDVVNGFIVGNVNRNQPRKRLDLAVQYFALWLRQENIKDAYLYLHVAPTGDQGYDCEQLAKYYGVADRLILAEPEMYQGTPEHWVATTIGSFDVQMTTTQGEGWGLTTAEGMACGVPQLLPRWSALGEWAAEAALAVPCSTTIATPRINSIGGVADRDAMIAGLTELYYHPETREELSAKGLKLISQDRFRWPVIAKQFEREFALALRGKVYACPLEQVSKAERS